MNFPQVGDVAPPLTVPALDGDSLVLGRSGKGRWQVWFVFNTTCPICVSSVPGWKAATARIARLSSVDVLGVSLDSSDATGPYVRQHDLPFPVALLQDPLDMAMYRIQAVPVTIVQDSVGKIHFLHAGVVSDSVVRALDAFFSGHLAAHAAAAPGGPREVPVLLNP